MRDEPTLAGVRVLIVAVDSFATGYVAAGLAARGALVTTMTPAAAEDQAAAARPHVAVLDLEAGSAVVLLAAESLSIAGVPFLLLIPAGEAAPALLSRYPGLHRPVAAFQVAECAATLVGAPG